MNQFVDEDSENEEDYEDEDEEEIVDRRVLKKSRFIKIEKTVTLEILMRKLELWSFFILFGRSLNPRLLQIFSLFIAKLSWLHECLWI